MYNSYDFGMSLFIIISIVDLVCYYYLFHVNLKLIFNQLGILNFVDLVKYKISIIMFKAYHNELPDSLQRICRYTYMILDKNLLSLFIVPIPT